MLMINISHDCLISTGIYAQATHSNVILEYNKNVLNHKPIFDDAMPKGVRLFTTQDPIPQQNGR